MKLALLSAFVLGFLTVGVAVSGDTAFTYQGELQESGAAANGSFVMKFSLWDSLAGGVQVGATITVNAQVVTDGLFDVELEFGAQDFGGSSYWLEIVVDGNTLAPRQALTASPYSVQTRGIFVNGTGRVGIGTTTPMFGLHVETLSETAAIQGNQTSPTGSVWGVRGTSASSNGVGVYGSNSSLTGSTRGGFFTGSSSDGGGLEARAVSTTGITYGLMGSSLSSSGRGVYGLSISSSGINYGVLGEARSPDGTGVYGLHLSTSGVKPGIHGETNSVSFNAVGVLGRIVSTIPGGWSSAVRGENLGMNVSGIGVWGSQAGGGWGVLGESLGTTGSGVGVRGMSNSVGGSDFFAAGAGVNYAAASSIRWKNDVRNIDNPLEKVARLRGVYYQWDKAHGGHQDMGMIAEEVGMVLPEIVAYEENGVDAMGLDYSKLSPLLVEAVNALRAEKDAQIRELQVINMELMMRIVAMDKEFEEIRKQLKGLTLGDRATE